MEPQPAQPWSPPKVWPVAAAFVIALCLVVPASAVLIVPYLVAGYTPETVFNAPGVIPLSAFLSSGTLVLVSFAAPKLFKDAPAGLAARLAWHPRRAGALETAVLLVCVIALGTVMEALVTMAGGYVGALALLNEGTRQLGPVGFAATLVFGAGGAGLGEELFFRGLAQTRLAERYGPAVGIGVASALFGLIHGDLLHTPMAFCIGVLLGWAAWRCGSIVPGVLVHALNNATSFTATWLGFDPTGAFPVPALVTSVVVLVAGLAMLAKRWPPPSVLPALPDAPAPVPVAAEPPGGSPVA